jgi:hypothetical protein
MYFSIDDISGSCYELSIIAQSGRESGTQNPGAEMRAGTKKTALFDIVNMETMRAAQRETRARALRVGGNALGPGRARGGARPLDRRRRRTHRTAL